MEWRRAIREEEAALGRIAALLCALAGLAACAAGRSAIVRALVLLFLRRAESAARDFVAGEPISLAASGGGFLPADALRLAASLLALAGEVRRQARSIVRPRRKHARRRRFPLPIRIPATPDLAGRSATVPSLPRPVLAPDTS